MLIGDMAIKNLAPRDKNSGGRIIKNMRICGSGLYEYGKSEAALMGLPNADAHVAGDTFFVYRPASVLVANKDLYARVPIITGHHVRVNTDNAKQLAVGMVGDTVESEVGEDGETYLYTTGTIITGDGIDAYERLGQLSVGYDPIVKWESGEYNGKHYDAVLTGFNEVNHLLICRTARGGPQCMIMDEAQWGSKIFNGGKSMGIFKKIFGGGEPLHGDAAVVSTLLQSISCGADPETQIAKVRGMIGDCKDDTFNGYLDELAGAKGEDLKVVAKAVDIVEAYYKKNVMGDEKKEEPKKEEPKKEEPKKEEPKKAEPKKAEENGDTEHPADCTCEECNKNEEKQTGDEQPAVVDYERIAKMIGDALDERLGKPAETEESVKEFNIPVAGDSAEEKASDAFMKEMF